MKTNESEVEMHFLWAVARLGGQAFKFKSVNYRGVSDRIACMPDGSTWFVELKTKGGKLSELQKRFAHDMVNLGQRYECFWDKEQIDAWGDRYGRA